MSKNTAINVAAKTTVKALCKLADIPYSQSAKRRQIILVRGGGHRTAIGQTLHSQALIVDLNEIPANDDKQARSNDILRILATKLNCPEAKESLAQARVFKGASNNEVMANMKRHDTDFSNLQVMPSLENQELAYPEDGNASIIFEYAKIATKRLDREHLAEFKKQILERIEATGKHKGLYEWLQVIDAGPQHVYKILVDTGEDGIHMRSLVPLRAFVTTHERSEIINKVRETAKKYSFERA